MPANPDPALWNDAFFDQKRSRTDPLADEVLLKIINDRGLEYARKTFHLLITNLELPLDQLPVQISEYLEQTNQLPDWIQPDQVEMAHDLFLDHGPKFLIFLYFKSLPLLYACANGAQVLFRTGRLIHDDASLLIFTRRIAETAQFLINVMTPGGLAPGQVGIRSIQKVRLIHAAIRQFMAHTDWPGKEYGKPINQEDMAVTLMTFSIATTDALPLFNLEEDTRKLEAYIHAWAGIGSLLGIEADLVPHNQQEARLLLDKILQRQAAYSEQGKLLTQALVQFAEKSLPGQFLDNAPETLIRYLVGPQMAFYVGLEKKYGCLNQLFPWLLKFIFGQEEKLEDKSPHWKKVIDQLSRHLVKTMMGYFDNYKGVYFHLPEPLKSHWKL
ncbi:MAG: oxygenase MpaB family protein [Candidatus Cyclobacteriaceae bacterium M3_2C_046]